MRAESGFSPDPVAAARNKQRVPLIAHVIYRLDVGGLENGLVNLINRIPAERFRHAIICLTDYTDFRRRIERSDVPVYALHKPPGNSPRMHLKLWRLFRRLRPDIVHSNNLAALEAMLPAALAGVPARVHTEHGRDVGDLDGSNRKNQVWHKLLKPLVDHYIPVSRDLERYLLHKIGVDPTRVTQIYNAVDCERFHPAGAERELLPQAGFAAPGLFVVGTVARMQAVKDQLTLARAFVLLMREVPQAAQRLRLAIIGDGPLREPVRALLADAGVLQYAWLPGGRDDVPTLLRGFDLFVLPSLAEGTSYTILEAMASGLPVVATAVGGNAELVRAGETGTLVPSTEVGRLAQAIRAYVDDAELCKRHGSAARRVIERSFSMKAMVDSYMAIYDRMLERRTS